MRPSIQGILAIATPYLFKIASQATHDAAQIEICCSSFRAVILVSRSSKTPWHRGNAMLQVLRG